jgi:hypothetical protein
MVAGDTARAGLSRDSKFAGESPAHIVYMSLMWVAMYHLLPKGSITPPLRSPYG